MSNHSVLSKSPSGLPVFYRTYSRVIEGKRETYDDVVSRNLRGLARVGKLTEEEVLLLMSNQTMLRALPSGRWLWVGGTDWLDKPENWSGAYNCTSTEIINFNSFADLMELAMMGSGTGAVIEDKNVASLPPITSKLSIQITGLPGDGDMGKESTKVSMVNPETYKVKVGDSRKGWVNAYLSLLILASMNKIDKTVMVDMSAVRPKGSALKGFGGIANPSKLPELFPRLAKILNKAASRESSNRLTALEICLIIDEAASVVVAGNIRRSAGMRQFSKNDVIAANSKANLWVKEGDHWIIDPERDALRMANHTMVFHTYPTYADIHASVKSQFLSGEGAIQFAPEAIARSNNDILPDLESKKTFIERYTSSLDSAKSYLLSKGGYGITEKELQHRMLRYGLNPCGEIIGSDFHCNLAEVHLNNLVNCSEAEIDEAFKAAAISVCCLLHRNFTNPIYKYSRDIDPIVGVSFTGLFDFFVHKFGLEWLKWWEEGRPNRPELSGPETTYLARWKRVVEETVAEYCNRHGLRVPNRSTTVQPAGCLDKNALRIFDQGLLYADEIVKAGSGETDNLSLSVRNGISTSSAIANQPLPLTKVVLKNGRILRMTANHRLSIQGKWVEAKDLMPGMSIDYSIGEYCFTGETELEPIDWEKYTREYRAEEVGHSRGVLAKEIETPTVMSKEFAYFIGALFGNGCLSESKYRVRFSHGRLDVLHRLSRIGKKLFGLTGSISHDSRSGGSELVFASKPLYDWLLTNGLAKTEKSVNICRIPLKVRRSSRKTILAFFAGLLDCDGSPRNGSFSIDLASEEFIRNLQQVGEAIGLAFGISHNTEGHNHQESKSIWSIHLSRMYSQWQSCKTLNKFSIKLGERPIQSPKRMFETSPFLVASVETGECIDYSYDFAVDGINDNDSWYWQGAIKSHNTKSLLSGASSGWHPPKAQRFIRRITFGKNDPVALACIGAGFSVVPSQSDKDEEGKLLQDPFDDRCTEWLVEIPTEVSWANIPGVDKIDINQFSATAQFDFYMQVQKYYTTHNCFSRNTEFLTDKGVKTFEDFNCGDEVKVLNANGEWSKAKIVTTGDLRDMYKIILRQGSTGKTKVITATDCHRFPVKRISDGNCNPTIKTTLQLKPGHRFITNIAELPDLDIEAIQHGIVFGDGSLYKTKGIAKGAQVYLCGKKRDLSVFFESNLDRTYEREEHDQTRIYGLPVTYKYLPAEDCSQSYLAGFLAGLFATDGNICGSTLSLSSAKEEVIAFICRQSPRLGISISSINTLETGCDSFNPGTIYYEIRFSKETFPCNMVLRELHQMHLDSKESQPRQWRVESITKLKEKQVGWCVMEPETNHFTLTQNILVMNTSATIEFRESEISALAQKIHDSIGNGYVSAALLARFDSGDNFPRLPFEPITKEKYDEEINKVAERKIGDFEDILNSIVQEEKPEQEGPAGCDSDKCLLPLAKPADNE